MIGVRNRGKQWRLAYHISIQILDMIVCMGAIWPKLKLTVRYRNTMEQCKSYGNTDDWRR